MVQWLWTGILMGVGYASLARMRSRTKALFVFTIHGNGFHFSSSSPFWSSMLLSFVSISSRTFIVTQEVILLIILHAHVPISDPCIAVDV